MYYLISENGYGQNGSNKKQSQVWVGNGGHLAGIKLKGLNRYHSRRNKIQTETKTSHEDLHQYLSAPKKSTFKNHSKALLKSTKESLLIPTLFIHFDFQ